MKYMMSQDIHPFALDVPDNEIMELYQRLDGNRWLDGGKKDDWSDGLPLRYARDLVWYWRHVFDWRSQERRINSVPQFTTLIDGHHIHFFHVRSAHKNSMPLLLVHGWPSGPIDFLNMIPFLTEPQEDTLAFDLVIPTIPGFGVSGPAYGWNLNRVASAFSTLMYRLGYDQWFSHGYDTGAGVVREQGLQHPKSVIGIHTTGMLGGERLTISTANMEDPEERRAAEDSNRFKHDIGAYAMLQSTRPQSLAYALNDSPVGLLAWLVERFRDWSGAEGKPEDHLNRDQILTLVSIYWFFGTIGSSISYYKTGLSKWSKPLKPSNVPTAILVMPKDFNHPVRRIAEKSDQIIQWTEADRGGHFAAWEEPELVAGDIRAAFKTLI